MIQVIITCDVCGDLIETSKTKEFSKVSSMLWAWDQEQMIQQDAYFSEKSTNLLCSHCFKKIMGEDHANA